MIQYSDISALVAEGQTPAQIATALQASGLTHRPIMLGDLLFLLSGRGMMVRLIRPVDSGEKWSGTLVNLINFCNDTEHPLAMPVNQFFSHITNDRNVRFDTTDPQYAGLFLAIVATFGGQPNMPTVEDFEAVADLGGGWKFSGVDEAAVQAAIALEGKRVVIESTRAAVNSRTTRINAWLDAIDMSLSVEEIESYIADLLSSDDGNPSGGGE
jgi:hypothetical protein